MPETLIYLTNVTLTLKVDPGGVSANFQGPCTSAAVQTEAGEESTVVTLDGIRHTRYGPNLYTLALSFVQDWGNPAGLANFLYAQERVRLLFTLALSNNGTPSPTNPSMQGFCYGVAPTFGGEAESWIEAEVEMPVEAKPSIVTALGEILTEPTKWQEFSFWQPPGTPAAEPAEPQETYA
jgi:hypothetical protein